MRIRAFAILCSVLVVPPMPVRADVSVTQQVQTSGFMPTASYTTRILRMKGLKLRVETKVGSMLFVTIYDLETGKRYRLDPQHRRVFVRDLKAVGERDLQHVAVDRLKREVRATGNKKEIMDITCDEFAFDLQAPSAHSSLHDSGTVCLTTANPAGSEIVNFVNEAKKRGYSRAAAVWGPGSSFSIISPFFYMGDQNILIVSAKTELWAENGARLDLTTTLTELSLSPISDEIFRIPSDWKFREDPEGR